MSAGRNPRGGQRKLFRPIAPGPRSSNSTKNQKISDQNENSALLGGVCRNFILPFAGGPLRAQTSPPSGWTEPFLGFFRNRSPLKRRGF